MQPFRAIVLTSLIAAALALTGCAPRSADWNNPRAADGPLRTADDQPRSLALDSPALSTLSLWHNRANAPTPWYHSRLDNGPSVVSGTQYPTFETSRTLTFDRQSVHNGRVRDSYFQTTVRDTRRQTIR